MGDEPAQVLFALAGGSMGAVVGSFLATVALRLPRGESVLTGRSRCDHCRRILTAGMLVPLLSNALQRGRCRHCGGAIDCAHSAIEAMAALIGVAAGWLFWDQYDLALASALLGWQLLLLGALDLQHRWLPDSLNLLLGLTGLAANFLRAGADLSSAAIGAFGGYAVLEGLRRAYRAIRRIDGMGGGDPKLLGGIGAWLGWELLPQVVLVGAVVGLAVLAVLHLARRGPARDAVLPLGTMLAAAALPVWLADLLF